MSQWQQRQKPRRQGLQDVLIILGLAALISFWLLGGFAEPSSTASLFVSSPPGTPFPTAHASATATDASAENATRQAIVQIELTDTHLRGTPLPPGVAKPTPTGITSRTPEPTALVPFPVRTPLGSGALAPIMPPFPAMQFRVTNVWYVDSDGLRKRTVVYAGAEPSTSGENLQGGVTVYVWQISSQGDGVVTNLVEAHTYLAAAQSQTLEIVDAVGERLILRSTNGTLFYFDLPTRQYVPSLTVTVTVPPPTESPVTPAPSETPAP